MSAEVKPDLQPEIAHILLIDAVGYSKLLVNEQVELLQELNRIVRATPTFRAAESQGKLIRIPTGDGMAPRAPSHRVLLAPVAARAPSARSKLAARCRIDRICNCAWASTAARLTKSWT